MRRTPTYLAIVNWSMKETKMFDKLTNATNTYYCELIDEQD